MFTGAPAIVPGVRVDDNSIHFNDNSVTLTLSWGEPFNNFDPIVNYTVSCSGDDACPPTFNTTDNAIIITLLTTMTTYTFSVVATNSIGSGEAGVVMITTPSGEIILLMKNTKLHSYIVKYGKVINILAMGISYNMYIHT